MDIKVIEQAVDTQLAKYPEIMNRQDIADALEVTYQYVPKEALKIGLPTLGGYTEGEHKKLRVHKLVLRQALISSYINANEKANTNTNINE